MRFVTLVITHLAALGVGFAAGIFLLPILSAPAAPPPAQVASLAQDAEYQGEFVRDLAGSDFLHWGEGTVSVSNQMISLQGSLAPGPAYRLYLSPVFVETEAEFEANRANMVQVGPIDVFENFIVPVPEGIDPADYTTAVVWCESFSEFITAASYR
mgnify:FL=1|jgi:hypothetical protein